ncbi:MAG TPA: biotin/lipoyl-containing protein [Candidatus Limnocylindria bacterium]|nr:biotin/lipoyl-containing protein [Candidatus Limnocylindria bacterium]
MSSAGRLRVTVLGAAGTTIQRTAAGRQGFPPAGRGELVIEQPAGPDEAGLSLRRFEVVTHGWRFEVVVEPAARAELREKAARAADSHSSQADVTLRAQIPGRVVRLWVSEGEQVEQGQRLLAVEAMKMENEVRAPHGGVVRGLRVTLEQTVERGDELLRIG